MLLRPFDSPLQLSVTLSDPEMELHVAAEQTERNVIGPLGNVTFERNLLHYNVSYWEN